MNVFLICAVLIGVSRDLVVHEVEVDLADLHRDSLGYAEQCVADVFEGILRGKLSSIKLVLNLVFELGEALDRRAE